MGDILGKQRIERKYFTGMNSFDEPSEIGETQCELIENGVISKAGKIIQRKGLVQLEGDIRVIANIVGLGTLETTTVDYLYAMIGTDFYRLISNVFTSIDSGFTNNLVTTMVQANNKLYISNGTDNVHSVDSADTVTDLGDTNTDPPKTTIYVYHDNRMFSAKDDLVSFSDIIDPETWDRAVNNFKALKGDKGDVTALRSFKEHELIIYKEGAILILETLGGTPLTDWNLKILNPNIGCEAGRTVKNVGNDHIFLGRDGVRLLSRTQFDTIQLGIISREVQNYIDDINWNAISTAHAEFFDNKYILAIPTSTATTPNTILIWDGLATLESSRRGIPGNSWTVIPAGTWDFTNMTLSKYDSNIEKLISSKNAVTVNEPTDATFGALYDTTVDGTFGGGVLTGTAVGGAAISANALDLTGGTVKYVDYDADLNADSQQEITFRFKLIPNYNGGAPATACLFYRCQAAGVNNNGIGLYHLPSSSLDLELTDSSGSIILSKVLGPWAAVSGQEFEFEVNIDYSGAGTHRIFIDGIQFDGTQTATGTISSNINLLRVGCDFAGLFTNDIKIDDFIVFDTVQHTANYTPDPSGLIDTNIYQAFQEDTDNETAIALTVQFRDETFGGNDIDKIFSHVFTRVSGGIDSFVIFEYSINQGTSNSTEPSTLSTIGGAPVLPIDLPFDLNDDTIVNDELYISQRGKSCQISMQHNISNKSFEFLGYNLYAIPLDQGEDT